LEYGFKEPETSICNKWSQGMFAATFFLATLVVLEVQGIRSEDV
jgi:hypothetical protein